MLDVLVTYSIAPFAPKTPLSPTAKVVQGQALTFPLHLWHDGIYFEARGGPDPVIIGDPLLSVSGMLPPGLDIRFTDPDPRG